MGINIEYMSFSDVQHQPQAWQDRILGIVVFSGSAPENLNLQQQNIPTLHLNAPVLSGENMACEVWLSAMPTALASVSSKLISGSQGAITYRFNNELLFGVINLEEPLSPQEGQDKNISPLQSVTEAAYQQIFKLIDKLGYTHLYRFWNYMADINGSSHELERYRQFNVGRKNVFVTAGREQGNLLPAACALGVAAGPLSIAFLAGKTVATAVENPRQIKAYDYPEEYGPRTPSFSRATLAEIGKNFFLFISGTASIVGHKTLHTQDIIGQTKETLINIEAVIDEANRLQGNLGFDLSTACFRVYVRHAQNLDLIRKEMQNYLKSEVKAVFVQADICRQELLVEIEATLQCEAKA